MTTSNLQIADLIDKLEVSLIKTIKARKLDNPLMIGIHSGGVWIAEQMHQRLNITEPLGKLDISFYRDDFSQIGINPKVKTSQLPLNIEARDYSD